MFDSPPLAGRLSGALMTAIGADGWREREEAIVAAADELLAVLRSRGLASPPPATTRYRVALRAASRAMLASRVGGPR